MFYVLFGIVGLIFFKKKYNLSFWGAAWDGVILGFGLYFGFGAVAGLFTTLTGLEPSTGIAVSLLFAGLSVLSFWILSVKHRTPAPRDYTSGSASQGQDNSKDKQS